MDREIIINFPENIKNEFKIIKFFNELLDDTENEMYYNMKNIKFFEASIVPYFHTINEQLFKTHEHIFYNEINKRIENFFLKNNYARNLNSKYEGINLEDIYKTYIEFTYLLKKSNEKSLDGAFYKISNQIKEKKLYDDNNELHSELLAIIGELTNNSFEHGNTEKAYFCGQYYPKLSKLSFSISNLGNTIADNVKYANLKLKDKEIYEWIFRYGTTTRKENEIGGMGLNLLKETVKNLGGCITVISDCDYYFLDENNNKELYFKLKNKYKGTTIIIDVYYERKN